MMIDGYYRARGWTEEGMVPESKLDELELADLVRLHYTVAEPIGT